MLVSHSFTISGGSVGTTATHDGSSRATISPTTMPLRRLVIEGEATVLATVDGAHDQFGG